jgi:ribosome-associated protein
MSKAEEFELSGHEFIELNKLLKFLGWVETGGEAKIRIEDGEVEVNGETEYRKRCKLRPGDKVQYQGQEVVIS